MTDNAPPPLLAPIHSPTIQMVLTIVLLTFSAGVGAKSVGATNQNDQFLIAKSEGRHLLFGQKTFCDLCESAVNALAGHSQIYCNAQCLILLSELGPGMAACPFICSALADGITSGSTICHEDAYEAEGNPQCPSRSTTYITSSSTCLTAARDIGIPVTKVAGCEPSACPKLPYGCYFKSSSGPVWFNSRGSKSTTSSRRSICQATQSECDSRLANDVFTKENMLMKVWQLQKAINASNYHRDPTFDDKV